MKYLFLTLLLLTAACQSLVNKVDLGNDRYAVTYVRGDWSLKVHRAMQLSVEKSREICDEHGQDSEILNVSTGSIASFWTGGYTTVSTTVQCKPKGVAK